jgi:hypothetical protein
MSAMKEQLWNMVETIDDVFGEGYAKKNPDLVGRMMQAEQTGFAAFQISEAFHSLVEAKDAKPA